MMSHKLALVCGSVLLAAGTLWGQPVFGPISPQVPSGTYRFATQVAVGDVNGDGVIDGIITDMANQYPPYVRRYSVYRNLGSGNFAGPASTILQGVLYPETHLAQPALAVGDLNGDGRADIVTSQQAPSSENGPNLAVLFGQPDGRLGGQINLATSATDQFMASIIAQGVRIGDVTGDGRPDIVSTAAYQKVSVIAGNGQGGFASPAVSGQIPTGATIVLLGDVDGDGDRDVVGVTRTGSGSHASSRVDVNLNDGSGVFAPAGGFVIDGNVSYDDGRRAILANMDGDSMADLAILGFKGVQSGLGGVYVFRATGGGSFAIAFRQTANQLPNVVDLAAADFTGDGVEDLAIIKNYFGGAGVIMEFAALGGTVLHELPGTVPAYVAMAAAGNVVGSALPDLVFSDTPGHTDAMAGLRWSENLLEASCYANCDRSTTPPVLTANDFQCFINAFAAGQSAANCDGSAIAPFLTANDFQCFVNRFAAGC